MAKASTRSKTRHSEPQKKPIKVGDYVDYAVRAKVVHVNTNSDRILGKYLLDCPYVSRYVHVEEDEITKSKEQ